MNEARVTVTVNPDVAQILEAFTEVGQILRKFFDDVCKALEQVWNEVSRQFRIIAASPVVGRALAIQRFGPDNVTADGQWISTMCATWLHNSCKAGVFCDCGCHA